MQAMPGGPVVNPGGGHPGVAYATQVIPAPAAQTAGQPQPSMYVYAPELYGCYYNIH